MATTDTTLLETDTDNLLKQFMLQGEEGNINSIGNESLLHGQKITLKPGFCLKTKDGESQKVFINVCLGENLPAPKDVSDEELLKMLEDESEEEQLSFRIPMSLGEPHAEVDKGGKGCTVYDVVINPSFYERANKSQVMLGFFLTVVLEGLEQKYSTTLDREWKMLKNKKFMGTLPEQHIRTQSKPWIMEMERSGGDLPGAKKSLISEIGDQSSSQESMKSKGVEPPYTILQEPTEGHPEYMVAEFHLPKVKMAATLSLDIGEDRILLQTRSNIYFLDIYLPYDVIQEECGAQFNKQTKILTITMPVQPVIS